MKRTLVALVALVVFFLVVFFIFVYSGIYNIAASEPHSPLVRWVLETTMRNSVEAHAEGVRIPDNYQNLPLEKGLKPYVEMCEMCHGAPGVKASELVRGLLPEPPELSKEVQEWKTQELFWIVKHGFKMTGMPAFGPTHREDEIWPIISFIENKLPSLSPEEYRTLKEELMKKDSRGPGHEQGQGQGH